MPTIQVAAAALAAACLAAASRPLLAGERLDSGPSIPAAEAQDAGPLAPLAFLAGSCWKGTFPGGTVTDEHCFEWMYGRSFLRDRHVVRGESSPYEGESTYAWDAQQKRIVYWYVALPGFFTQGWVEPAGEVLTFRENVVAANGTRVLLTSWVRKSPDAYMVKTLEIVGDAGREVRSVEMRRVSR